MSDPIDVEREIARLERASLVELRVEWERWYRTTAPNRLGRDLLLRAVTYRLQEHAHGGLTQTTKRLLRSLARQAAVPSGRGEKRAPAVATPLRPGVRLVRQWNGDIHEVVVLQDGFSYSGTSYRSLTQVARVITGAHWSGPRFFGTGPRTSPSDRSSLAAAAQGKVPSLPVAGSAVPSEEALDAAD